MDTLKGFLEDLVQKSGTQFTTLKRLKNDSEDIKSISKHELEDLLKKAYSAGVSDAQIKMVRH